MQKFEQRDNSGALFTNDKKTEYQPDFKGKCMVNGKEMEVAVWNKTSKAGRNFMSMSFSERWVNPNAEVEQPQEQPVQDLPSNDLPF